MIVELIGPPGAGKTTFLPTVIDALSARGLQAYTVLDAARPFARRTLFGRAVLQLAPQRWQRALSWQVFYWLSLFHRLKFILAHNQLVRQVVIFQWRRPTGANVRQRRVLDWFYRHLGYYEFLKHYARPNETLIFDEGFLHRVVQLFASQMEEPPEDRIRAYLALIPIPDLTIAIQAPPRVCEQRIYARGLWDHLRSKSPAEVSRFVENAHLTVVLAVATAKGNGWQVIEVDNGSHDLQHSKAELSARLDDFFKQTGRAASVLPEAVGIASPSQALRPVTIPRPSRLGQYARSRLRTADIEEETVHEVLSYYALKAVRSPCNLPTGRRSRNVIVPTVTGKKVLKRYKPTWQAPLIVHAHSILGRLSEIGFPAPRLEATTGGETFVAHQGQHFALFDFIPGASYASSYLTRSNRLKVTAVAGKTLASFHHCLEGFVPAGQHHLGFPSYVEGRHRDLAWYLERLGELHEKSTLIPNAEDQQKADWLLQNKNYLLEGLSRLDENLETAQLPRLVIHGDYGLHNLLFTKDGSVVILDFELAHLDWRLSDLIFVLSRMDFETSRSFMAGYQADFPLSADEWRYLPQVWQMRMLQRAVQYWNAYFEMGGGHRLAAAGDNLRQADWAIKHQAKLIELKV